MWQTVFFPPSVKVKLKYDKDKLSAITEIKKISKPGKKVYVGTADIPKIMNGLGTAVLSTSKGVMTDKKARELGVGGELVCSIY